MDDIVTRNIKIKTILGIRTVYELDHNGTRSIRIATPMSDLSDDKRNIEIVHNWKSFLHTGIQISDLCGDGLLLLKGLGFSVYLPWFRMKPDAFYGIMVERSALSIGFGKRHFCTWPWRYEVLRDDVLTKNNSVAFSVRYVPILLRRLKALFGIRQSRSEWSAKYHAREAIIEALEEKYPYTYKLKSGEEQKRTATVHVTRVTYGMIGLPLLRKTSRYLQVKFDEEVGEESGSWKGGCVGCSYEMRDNETAEQALRRMEADRKFHR